MCVDEPTFNRFLNSFNLDELDEKKGFFNGLKEKAEKHFAKQPDLTPKFAGPPPGSHHAPDGWNFATNRGPTAGNYQVGELGSGLSQGYVNPLNPAQQDPTEILKKKSYGTPDLVHI